MKHLEKELIKNNRQIEDLDSIDSVLKRLMWDIGDTDLRKKHKQDIIESIYQVRLSMTSIMAKYHVEGCEIEKALENGNK